MAIAADRIASTERRLAQVPLWRWDTQTVVGSVILAVAFTVTMQITERIDLALTGGLAVPLGFTFAAVWWPLAVIFFGLTGAILVSNFNPLIGMLTATHPLVWSFPFLNMASAIPMAILMKWHLRRGKTLRLVDFYLYIAIGHALAIVTMAIGIWALVLKLAVGQMIFLGAVQFFVGVFVGGTMGFALYRTVARSGVLETGVGTR